MDAHPRVVVALQRLKGLFLEVPDTSLSITDAARLSGIDLDLCAAILPALEDVRFLKREHGDLYQRRTFDGPLEKSATGTELR